MKTIPEKNTSIIHGTHRPEDLLGTLLFALEDYNMPAARRFNSELISRGFGYSQCGVCGMGNRDDWPQDFDDDVASELIEELFDALNEVAPEGCYFGAHPGDGSDFGFWESGEE